MLLKSLLHPVCTQLHQGGFSCFWTGRCHSLRWGCAQESSSVLAIYLTSSHWEGIGFNEEMRAGLDPKHIWETPRINYFCFLGGIGRTAILVLVRDNEPAKFGCLCLCDSMYLQGDIRGDKVWSAHNIIYYKNGYYKLHFYDWITDWLIIMRVQTDPSEVCNQMYVMHEVTGWHNDEISTYWVLTKCQAPFSACYNPVRVYYAIPILQMTTLSHREEGDSLS